MRVVSFLGATGLIGTVAAGAGASGAAGMAGMEGMTGFAGAGAAAGGGGARGTVALPGGLGGSGEAGMTGGLGGKVTGDCAAPSAGATGRLIRIGLDSVGRLMRMVSFFTGPSAPWEGRMRMVSFLPSEGEPGFGGSVMRTVLFLAMLGSELGGSESI